MALTLLNNRYRTIQDLGSGGFGNTFLAEDTHMPSARRCVIKQLKPVTNNPQMYQQVQARFQREAAVLEALGEVSKQIPQLYAYFSEAGQFYLVQEWVDGDTLTKIIERQGALPEKTVRDILVSLLSVLEYVHSKQMVHRDIKPDNIIVRDRDRQPVLIDFGAVKEAMGSTNQTMVIGTPGFMPSEQAAGQPVYATDLYSLGVTAIYLLTGKMPQDLPTDPGTGMIMWHGSAPGVSPSLASVLDKTIQPHPRDRFSTAKEMLNALQKSVNSPVSNPLGTQATVAVSPVGRQYQPSPQNTPVVTPSQPNIITSNESRWLKPWVLAILIICGFVGSAIAFNRIFNKNTDPTPQVASSPPSQPTNRNTEETNESDSSNSQKEIPPVISESSSPLPSKSPKPSILSQPQATEQPPVIIASPSPIVERSPSPVIKSDNSQNQNRSDQVPAFPTGTPISNVQETLGKPRINARGVWGNTRAVVYKLKPNQIDLGYLYDRNTENIRQTEVSFSNSVDPQLMLNTLDGLLEGGATPEIKQGLLRVQQGRNNSFTFTQGSLKGQIVQQDCGFIYISIWEADLHNFNVSSSRKC
ncbi:serine/threonine protein kinase [Crinalium epipsammum PCC 9333]|uniref:non-specific serine/threonine protein kinase n=1 Tax=Crinalium epipsammum PCC 9333 TaxID=1173022 RepID=K9W3L0_9CYAN|nr:serine/threonine-protein kinase [Crinalium epipsammum]AFZ14791.1 serine/threonine protein kinase [Crinalium epipsammum PCC 9333]